MFKKIIFVFVFYILFSQNIFANNYVEKTIDSYKFRYIKYDTKSKDYIFKIWVRQDYNATSLRKLMEENNWISAVNWVFFCPDSYSECWWKNFTKNERYFQWEKIWTFSWTQNRVVFALDKENSPFLFQTDKINQSKENEIYYWFSNFPLLLQDWINKFQDYTDLWLIDEKMKAKMSRNFICSDVTNRFIYSWYVSSIELEKLPELLIKIWCNNALNLDAWGSSAMIYNSRYIIWPWRDILDWVIIERKNLDTKKIIDRSIQVKNLIEKKILNKNYEQKIDFLNNFTDKLSKIRTIIYEKNSRNLLDWDTWKKIWYEINIKKSSSLEIVYFINYLSKLIFELKNEYNQENNQKLKKEIENNNNKNLLF